jgi:hypothetical protein
MASYRANVKRIFSGRSIGEAQQITNAAHPGRITPDWSASAFLSAPQSIGKHCAVDSGVVPCARSPGRIIARVVVNWIHDLTVSCRRIYRDPAAVCLERK